MERRREMNLWRSGGTVLEGGRREGWEGRRGRERKGGREREGKGVCSGLKHKWPDI